MRRWRLIRKPPIKPLLPVRAAALAAQALDKLLDLSPANFGEQPLHRVSQPIVLWCAKPLDPLDKPLLFSQLLHASPLACLLALVWLWRLSGALAVLPRLEVILPCLAEFVPVSRFGDFVPLAEARRWALAFGHSVITTSNV